MSIKRLQQTPEPVGASASLFQAQLKRRAVL